MVPSRIPSIKPPMVVMGVRRSWDTLAMRSRRWVSMFSMASAIWLKLMVNAYSSSRRLGTATRQLKSPWAKFRAAAAMFFKGRTVLSTIT